MAARKKLALNFIQRMVCLNELTYLLIACNDRPGKNTICIKKRANIFKIGVLLL